MTAAAGPAPFSPDSDLPLPGWVGAGRWRGNGPVGGWGGQCKICLHAHSARCHCVNYFRAMYQRKHTRSSCWWWIRHIEAPFVHPLASSPAEWQGVASAREGEGRGKKRSGGGRAPWLSVCCKGHTYLFFSLRLPVSFS